MFPPPRRSAVVAVGLCIVLCACDAERASESATSTAPPASSSPSPSASLTFAPTATPDPTSRPSANQTASPADAVVHCSGTASSPRTGRSVEGDSIWAGYVAARPPASFSCVEASWLEPTVTCGAANAAVGIWVGIGGYTSEDLGIIDNVHALQRAGTGVECEDGQADHYAWHQVAPRDAEDQLFDPAPDGTDMVVEPGDVMWAQVRYTDPGFVLTVANLSSGDVRSTIEAGAGQHRSSAEWIVGGEPGEPIARFGSVAFTGGQCTMDGIVGPIGSATWLRNEVDEWTGGVRRLRVSPLSADGGSFQVDWVHR